MESKIVQIQSCVQNNMHVLTALCEDGSVYNTYDCNDWVLFEEPFKAAKKKEETPETIDNTAMLQLLSELRNYLGCGVENRKSDIDFIDRIDVALAQQHY